jgi:ribosomal protein S18 acetylase RimI-like enzyme
VLSLRPFGPHDLEPTVALWHQTKRAAYPYLPAEQTRALAEDRAFFTTCVLGRCSVWVADDAGLVVGFLALAGSYLDRLYVRVGHQRAGIGQALLEQARRLSPDGLELHTHQANTQARAFYEKHGFRVVELGISPPPECAPDVKYLWEPYSA